MLKNFLLLIFLFLNFIILTSRDNDNYVIFYIVVLSYFFILSFLYLFSLYQSTSLLWIFIAFLMFNVFELFLFSSSNI